jgi:hypothetical protein
MSYTGIEGLNSKNLSGFPNPFSTYARTLYPRTVKEVFDWSEFMWLHFGVYTQAIKKCVRYFLTDLEIVGDREHNLSYETRKKYETNLRDGYRILNMLGLIGDDLIGFGNSFTSAYIPIRRELGCPACGTLQPIDQVKEYRFENFEFKGKCGGCGAANVTFIRKDMKMQNSYMPVKVIRWSARDIMLDYCPITDETDYYLKMPDEWKKAIQKRCWRRSGKTGRSLQNMPSTNRMRLAIRWWLGKQPISKHTIRLNLWLRCLRTTETTLKR